MRTGFLWRSALPIALGFGLALWVNWGDHSDATEPPPAAVVLTVRPLIMQTRSNIHIEARVPPHAENSLLTIAWTSDSGSTGETTRQLEGEDAPLLHTRDLPSQPPANYVFLATVFNRVGKIRGQAQAAILMPDGAR